MEFARIIDCRNTLVIRLQPNPDLCGDTIYMPPLPQLVLTASKLGTEDTAHILLGGWRLSSCTLQWPPPAGMAPPTQQISAFSKQRTAATQTNDCCKVCQRIRENDVHDLGLGVLVQEEVNRLCHPVSFEVKLHHNASKDSWLIVCLQGRAAPM